MSPYETLYGRDLADLGVLGKNLTPPKYRLFSEEVKEDLLLLKQTVQQRIASVEKKITSEKEKYLDKANRTRPKKDAFLEGDVVFLKDFSIPRSGRARKFRTTYLKSPHIVLSASETSVVSMRLADSFVSRHHPDSFLKYRGPDKDMELFKDLPDSVLAFLGKPMSQESLITLCKTDKLEPIYTDKTLLDRDTVLTRSANEKRIQLAKEMTEQILDAEDSDDEEDVVSDIPNPRRVRFLELPNDQ